MPRFEMPYPPLEEILVPCTLQLDCPCASHWCFRYCDGEAQVMQFLGYIQNAFKARDARESVKKRLFWITINPPREADADPISFLDRVCDLLPRRKWINQCYYSIEQRSTDPDGPYTGIHAHLLVVSECPGKTVKRPAQAHREIYSWFVKMYPTLTKPAIDLKTYPMDFFDDKMDYLNGLKDDTLKDPKIVRDRQFRSKYGFQPVYSYDFHA